MILEEGWCFYVPAFPQPIIQNDFLYIIHNYYALNSYLGVVILPGTKYNYLTSQQKSWIPFVSRLQISYQPTKVMNSIHSQAIKCIGCMVMHIMLLPLWEGWHFSFNEYLIAHVNIFLMKMLTFQEGWEEWFLSFPLGFGCNCEHHYKCKEP